MGRWDELKKIRDIDSLQLFWRDNKDFLKKLALPAAVAIAVIFFWFWGNQGETPVIEKTVGEEGLAQDINSDNQAVQNEEEEEGGLIQSEQSENLWIYVDIGGEVVNPGVYQVKQGTRLFQVIEEAGGLTEEADTDGINQAEMVADGQKIIVGSSDHNSPYYGQGQSEKSGAANQGAVQQGEEGAIVNINLANAEELQQIPGIGPVTASKIIEYRETNGSFQKKEDIKNVSGIGDKTYESLKDYICV